MDQESAAEWHSAKEELFKQSKVISPLDALMNSKSVDVGSCPHCGNTENNVQIVVSQRHESSKSDIWGSKTDRDDEKGRFQCSNCYLRF